MLVKRISIPDASLTASEICKFSRVDSSASEVGQIINCTILAFLRRDVRHVKKRLPIPDESLMASGIGWLFSTYSGSFRSSPFIKPTSFTKSKEKRERQTRERETEKKKRRFITVGACCLLPFHRCLPSFPSHIGIY